MNFEKYVNQFPWPPYHAKPKAPVARCITTAAEADAFKQELAVYEQKLQAYEQVEAVAAQAIKAYQQEESRLLAIFWKDLFEELKIPEDHPKAAAFKTICWDNGHSGGCTEVYAVACELAALM